MVIKTYFFVTVWFLHVVAPVSLLGADNGESVKRGTLHGIWQSSQERFMLKQHGLAAAFTAVENAPASSTWLVEPVVIKSRRRAFFQSLLLPGWGQYYAESKTMMKIFIVSEVLTWASYLGFTTWSNWLEDDYRTFATTHAGVKTSGKSADYFVDIGSFSDIFEYNQAQLRDRDVSDLYLDTSEFFWHWDSEANREQYDDLRKRSALANNRSEFALATIFINHLVSAIHSTLAVYRFNKKQKDNKLGLRLRMDGTPNDTRLAIVLTKQF